MLIICIIGIMGIMSAAVAKAAASGGISYYWTLVPSILSSFAWIYMIRGSERTIMLNNTIWIVVYEVSYCAILIMMGDNLTLLKGIGCILVLCGLILINK